MADTTQSQNPIARKSPAGDSIAQLECWRPVVGYEDTYEVSNLGVVRRLRTWKGWRAGRPLKRQLQETGYLKVDLYHDDIGDPQTVHVVVARAFLGPQPTPKHEVAHWDGDKTNCRASNLRWATRKENQADRVRHGTDNRGEKHPRAKLTAADVIEMRRLRRKGMIVREIAALFSINPGHVGAICRGQEWKHVEDDHA